MHRPADPVNRYGGENFIMIQPDITGDGAPAVAPKVLASVAALKMPHANAEAATAPKSPRPRTEMHRALIR